MTVVKPLIVVKVGGRIAEDDELIFAIGREFKDLAEKGYRLLLVHGGGVTISELQRKYGVEPEFIDGLRQTPPDEMPLVDMALAGAVNKRLVRLLRSLGVDAWGMCGVDAGVISAVSVSGRPNENRTGRVRSVNTAPLETLWSGGYTPVLAPPSADENGYGINVNADEAALAVAESLKASHLVFISDVPGVLDQGAVMHRLSPKTAKEKINSGVISGGMIPKVQSAVNALKLGVGAVIIGDYVNSGDLRDLLSSSRGTCIDLRGGDK
ncbi:MAG: acetylglutamate kinase [Spirochaetaceae bacterium]|nr:acetylglutamate kinase [Spirochaetaceae bacterium]